MKAMLVENGNGWLVKLENGKWLTEFNMFGGVELVEVSKEEYGFDLKAVEYLEKNYNVEIWKSLDKMPEIDFC